MRGGAAILSFDFRQDRDRRCRQGTLAEQAPKEVRNLKGKKERCANRTGAEEGSNQLVAKKSQHTRHHRPGGCLGHILILARLLGHRGLRQDGPHALCQHGA